MKTSLKTNKAILIILILLAVLLGLFTYKYFVGKKEKNLALKIKVLSQQENKRTPKSWSQLIKKPDTKLVNSPVIEPAKDDEVVDTQELAIKLNIQMRKIRNLDVLKIDEIVSLAEEILSREPESYMAYKAKLIALLTKEGKFHQIIDDVEISGLLESMAQFNLSGQNLARREGLLIGSFNSGAQKIEAELDSIAVQKEALSSELNEGDLSSTELIQINAQLQQLENQEQELLVNLEQQELKLSENTAQMINEDIVEIPFMRMLAQNDYEAVIDNAEDFIEQFPKSSSGYFYLIRALELKGDKEQALEVIQSSQLPSEDQQILLQRLESYGSEDPKNYWQNLSF